MPVTAESLFRKGYKHLVSVIPPEAKLTPASRVGLDHRGKAPGIRKPGGLWSGYNWRKHTPTMVDAIRWDTDGANIGLKADFFPGVDIDTMDLALAKIIRNVALNTLGLAPIRIGNSPKHTLVYRTEEPFSRMRLWIDDRKHLVEVLGQGQQYLVAGTHPATMQPYRWVTDIPKASQLTEINALKAQGFLLALQEILVAQDHTVNREGDGRVIEHVGVVQGELIAPSIQALTEAVEKIPNDNNTFPERRDYLRMGYAIKSSAGAHVAKGEAIFQGWAAKWEGNSTFAGNDPLVVHDDYVRMRGPFVVGWPWIKDKAGIGGADEFDV